MDWDQIQADWESFKARMRTRWQRLTEADLELIRGDREQAIGRLQHRYEMPRERAEQQLDDWYRTL